MRTRSIASVALVAAFAVSSRGSRTLVAAGQQSAQVNPFSERSSPSRVVLDRYCVGCHNERTKASYAGLALDAIDVAKPGEHPEVWRRKWSVSSGPG